MGALAYEPDFADVGDDEIERDRRPKNLDFRDLSAVTRLATRDEADVHATYRRMVCNVLPVIATIT